jgi:PLP dependent protein
MSHISQALHNIRSRMAEAALRAGRNPAEITLIAVSKTFPEHAICEAYDNGQRDFGENRVEDALPKMDTLSARFEADPPRWHLIGHVQSRKARLTGRRFALLHAVDTLKLAARLDALAPEPQPVLLQCNVSGEVSKEGFDAAGWFENDAKQLALLTEIREIAALPNVRIQGLMTLAPVVENAAEARPVFAALRGLRDWLAERIPEAHWHTLSMGMSDDFEAAIAEGATHIRIGRAIFGAR